MVTEWLKQPVPLYALLVAMLTNPYQWSDTATTIVNQKWGLGKKSKAENQNPNDDQSKNQA